MKELIRHILKENRLQQEMKQFIEDNNIFDAAEMVGGLDNLKSIFKDDLELSEMLNQLTGVVDFEYHDAWGDPRFVVFPIEYEIIGIKKNIWGTHSWPELNLIYDDSKLTSAEKKKLITILATIQNDNTVGKIETNLPEIKSSGYFDVRQINGKDVDIHDEEFPFSKEDVKRIHNKLYGESESLNESDNRETDKNLRAINVLLSLVSWDGLCDIWAEYNPDDKEYEIRSKTLSTDDLATSITEIEKELNSLEDSIKSMGIKVYIYTPWYVDSCDDEVKFMNESSNRNEKDTQRLFKIIKMIMEDMILPEYGHLICSYEITLNEDFFNIPQVTVLFIGGYGTEYWPVTQAVRNMYNEVLDAITKEIATYTGVVIYVDMLQTPKCEDKENIYLRESESEDKDYSPAGKEITPNHIVVHKSNPMYRDKIMENGLKVRAGECYKVYVGYGVKCKPAIFATNSTNKRAWFDSTYDDDIWFIDTTMIPDVKWFKDRHFESRSKHIVTFQDIPKEAITLKYEGTGSSEDVLNSWPEDSPNRLQESIRSILREDSLKNDLMESEDKKLDLVKQMILQLFDEVEYIEIDEIYGKPLIKIYHDVDDTAANYDSWFEEVIEDKIDEMTGGNIILCSWWAPVWHYKRKNADFFIDVEKIEYDDDGNEINESEEKQPKYLDIIKDIVEPFKNEDCVCDIRVLYNEEDDMYLIDVEIGLFDLKEKFFAEVGRNHYVKKIRLDIKETIKGYIPIDNFYVGSYSTPKCGEKRWWDKNINESDNKEQSLQKLIDQHGLYDFIKMTGLDFNQVKTLLSKVDNPKEILKQYIREFVLEHDGMSGDNYGSLFALNLPLSDTKYVNDILVQDSGQSAVEIWEYHLDEYGHREQKDQYLTSIITLTNDELLSILSWMMEVIEGGYWD
jgi:hypothetical protein